MNTSNKHWVEAHAGRQLLSTKAARVLVVLAIVASVAAAFLPAFHYGNIANQQMTHHICSSCGEEIPQEVHSGIQMAGGVPGGVVNDNA
ncbi:MAG: hypothetical protein U0175_23305 [Caldilineaceae bacterium]